MFLDKLILIGIKVAGKAINSKVREEIEAKTKVAVGAAAAQIKEALKESPEVVDFLRGEEIVIEHRIRMKQKGEL